MAQMTGGRAVVELTPVQAVRRDAKEAPHPDPLPSGARERGRTAL